MTRLIHLTDLHFGLERPELTLPLADAVLRCQPDFLVVSGDLTQRARSGQFRRAMDYLNGFGLPMMVIPGNHDIPLFNLPLRFLAPRRGYLRHASADLQPMAQVGPLRLFGTDTSDPFSWRRGILHAAEVDRICTALRDSPADAVNILVCHHPLEEPPGFQRGETRGARAGLQRLAEAGLHLVMSGHLHAWSIGLGITPDTPRALFQMQTGTALCGRAGEGDHGFAVLDVAPGKLQVTPWLVDESVQLFQPRPRQDFTHQGGLWISA